jgi:transcriptional regulator with XRE-family HTH domain
MITSDRKTSLLDQLLDGISPAEQHRTDNRMMLAARIADAMQEKGITQIQLAKMLNKHHSVITQWLSGTQNFTIDTLSDIEGALGINLLQFNDSQPIIIECHFIVQQDVSTVRPSHLSNSVPISHSQFSLSNQPKRRESAYC